LPLLLMLVVGVAVGVWIGRGATDEPAPPATAAPAPKVRQDPAIVFDTPPAPRGESPRDTGPRITHATTPSALPAPDPYANGEPYSATTGVLQPIDAGPVFNQQFAAAEKQGLRDAALDAHRALEREPRDDSWSYPLEAEIENSLVADTSMGNFRREHIECRTSMCEIRLSAEGAEQIEALRQWTSDIQRLPWASKMLLSSASTISSDERMDSLLIVAKPPAASESPPPDR
jgi:hypothetical protein